MLPHLRPSFIGPAAFVLIILVGCGRPEAQRVVRPQGAAPSPQPTDPLRLRDRDGGGEDHEGRNRYFEQMHRAPDGLDWRAIDAANWRAEHTRRLGLAQQKQTRSNGAQGLRSSGPPSVGPSTIQGQPPGSNASGPVMIADRGYWEEVGSSNQAGHTRCAALGPEVNGQQNLYVGSAGGGLWISPDSGDTWSPTSDSVYGGVDEVVVLAPANNSDPDIVIMRRGSNLFRSTNGGFTWTAVPGPTGLTSIQTMTRLYDGNQSILMLVKVNPGSTGHKSQLYKSMDLGASFQLQYEAATAGDGDLWTPQSGPGAGLQVFIAINGQLLRSDDGGQTFPGQLDLNPGNVKCHITGSEAAGPTLYLVLKEGSNWRLYRSDDGGSSALTLGTISGYWGNARSMTAFTTDAMHLVYGGVNGYRSTDGGMSFQMINSWGEYYGDPANKLHADLRGLDLIRKDLGAGQAQDNLYFNTDGGTYLSTDHGLTVHNLSLEGLGVGQFYATHTSSRNPDRIAGGTQDQGYQHGERQPNFGPGPSTPFEQLISGDYGHLVSGDGTHDFLYSTYPGFILIQQGEYSPSLSTKSFPSGSNHLWLPPLAADPDDPEAFYFLADRLWRYQKNGPDWQPVQHSAHDFAAGSGSFLSALHVAPSDTQRMYAVTNSGRLWWSIDGGLTWTEASDSGPSSHYFYGNDLIVDPVNPLHALVCGSGYSGPGVRETFDGGDHWSAMDTGLPNTMVYGIAWSPSGNGNVYAATGSGAYRYIHSNRAWENIMGLDAPSTSYWSVETVAPGNRVRFGTHGRGIWDFVLANPGRNLGGIYCDPAIPNSSLHPGQLVALGRPFASEIAIQLSASQLPPGEMGYFMVSAQRDHNPNPAGSDGILCVGPNHSTYALQSTGAAGDMQQTVHLGLLPPNGSQMVTAGSTWYFQAWHTDFVLQPTGNFTNAVGVHFH